MNKYLINESPLQFSPTLAACLGVNEAIFLQQLNYWLMNPKVKGVMIDGNKWIFNSYQQWQQENFPFWSIPTIQRMVLRLEKAGILITKHLNTFDRRKLYRIDFEALNNEIEECNASKRYDQSDQDDMTLFNKDYTETTNPLVSNSDEFETQAENSSTEKSESESQTGKKSKKAEPKKTADEWTHFGKNREMAIKFSESSGIKPVGKEYGKWNKALNALAEAGILAEHIPRIVAEMRRSELTIGGPESLLKIGRDMLARGKLKTISHTAEPQEKVEYETWLDENGCWRSRRKVKSTDERSGISAA